MQSRPPKVLYDPHLPVNEGWVNLTLTLITLSFFIRLEILKLIQDFSRTKGTHLLYANNLYKFHTCSDSTDKTCSCCINFLKIDLILLVHFEIQICFGCRKE